MPYPNRGPNAKPEHMQYRVVDMNGHPTNSETYSTAALDRDALSLVMHIQAVRGGRIQQRHVSEWEDYSG